MNGANNFLRQAMATRGPVPKAWRIAVKRDSVGRSHARPSWVEYVLHALSSGANNLRGLVKLGNVMQDGAGFGNVNSGLERMAWFAEALRGTVLHGESRRKNFMPIGLVRSQVMLSAVE